jgi:multiple sugar transport system substrate-binding protein
MYYYFVLGAGGWWINEQGEWEVNSPECVEALQFEVDIVHKYKVTQPNPAASGMDTIQGIFSEGRCATYWGPPWTLGQIRDSHPELLDDLWVTDYPTKSGKPAPMYIQDAFALYKGGKHLDEVAKFIEFWSQDKYQVKFNKTESLIPVTISAGNDPYFQDNAFLSRFVKSIPNSKTYPFKIGWETVNVEVRSAVQRALLQQQTPKQALDEAQRNIMAAIK